MGDVTGKYGPYIHQLNKGGLKEIINSGKLRGTEARDIAGGGIAVRASIGSVEYQLRNPGWRRYPENTWIEFYADVEPLYHPGFAIWGEDKLTDGHLPIKITRVVRGDGTPHPEGTDVLRLVQNGGPAR